MRGDVPGMSMGIHLTSGASFRSGSLLCKHLHVLRESHLNLTVSGDTGIRLDLAHPPSACQLCTEVSGV